MIFIIIIIMMNPQYLHSQHHGTSGRCPSPKSFPQDVKRPSRASQLWAPQKMPRRPSCCSSTSRLKELQKRRPRCSNFSRSTALFLGDGWYIYYINSIIIILTIWLLNYHYPLIYVYIYTFLMVGWRRGTRCCSEFLKIGDKMSVFFKLHAPSWMRFTNEMPSARKMGPSVPQKRG